MTDEQLIDAYKKAYSDPNLNGIEGDLRVPNGPDDQIERHAGQAFAALLQWAGFS